MEPVDIVVLTVSAITLVIIFWTLIVSKRMGKVLEDLNKPIETGEVLEDVSKPNETVSVCNTCGNQFDLVSAGRDGLFIYSKDINQGEGVDGSIRLPQFLFYNEMVVLRCRQCNTAFIVGSLGPDQAEYDNISDDPKALQTVMNQFNKKKEEIDIAYG